MTLPHLRLHRPSPGVAVLTLDRPDKLNALNSAVLHSLTTALADLADDAEEGGLRALVVTGAGRGFCAGVDLGELAQDVFVDDTTIDDLRYFPVPVIAAVNGPAIGGGLELALAADLRVASEQASFVAGHAGIGIVPLWGLTARLPQAVGQAWARQMSFTREPVDAATALRIGLVNEVTAADALLPRAVQLATAIAQSHAPTVARIREFYDLSRDGTGTDALAAEVDAAEAAGGLAILDPDTLTRRAAARSADRPTES